MGKTTLATIAAKALGWEHIDTDELFETAHKTTIAEYITTHGWESFRRIEHDLLSSVLSSHPTQKVIACGGGVVELRENRELLKAFARERGVVLHVMREKEKVLEYLRNATHFPLYHGTAVETWERRAGWFSECCSYEFVSLTVPIPPSSLQDGKFTPEQTLALKPVEEDFFRLLRFIHGVDTNKVPIHLNSPHPHRTYFLCLTYPDITQALPVLEDLSHGIDMWELRVDFLQSLDLTFLAFQIALLRRHSNLPILFNLRSISQGGKYPNLRDGDQEGYDRLEALLRFALRLGVEYLSLELIFPPALFNTLMRLKQTTYKSTSIIGSFHTTVNGPSISWQGPETRRVYEQIVRLGCDLVMITNVARRFEDNLALRSFAEAVEREFGVNRKPLIAVNILPEVRFFLPSSS